MFSLLGELGSSGLRIRFAALLGLCAFLLVAAESRAASAALLDGRGWELVSPADKNGGQVNLPGSIADGGLLQAAAQGGSITYASATSFGPGAQGAPPASQYVATRGAGGWSNANITAPIFSGSYAIVDEGVPYRLFSEDLARGLLLNGDHCRGEGEGCAVANPPLLGSGAPEGYQNYYLRDSGSGGFAALLGSAQLAGFDPAQFDVIFAGASPDLGHVVLSSCAALTANATETPLGEGCDPTAQNLYEWSAGGGLSLLNLLPGQSTGAPGAALAAQARAVSADGSRTYWTHGGNLYLREGAVTKQVDADAGGGGAFQTASADGSAAFFTKAGHLWRYQAGTDTATDLTPSGGVTGVLGASASAAYLYYQDGSGLKLWHEGAAVTIAPGATASAPGSSPPTTGTARVSADGEHLAFLSNASLTGYDNTDKVTGIADTEVFVYDAGAPSLVCASCNPSNARPLGPSTIPGSVSNGAGPNATDSYKPRALSADGKRVFFDSSDALVVTDTNAAPDVYEWEAQGSGSCAKAPGCVALISDGRDSLGSSFADASADGGDVYFLSAASLVTADPGSIDLYDARVGGGFPEPPLPIPCEGDACQVLPSEPIDPTLTTLLTGLGNPPVRYHRYKRHEKPQPKRRHKHHHKKGSGKKHGGGR